MAFSQANAFNEYVVAGKQLVQLSKSATRTSIALTPFSVFDIAGIPAAGTLAGASTAAGVKPDDSTTGCPVINAFSGSNTGYITRVEYYSSVIGRLTLYDMLFKAGAYAFNSGTTSLSSQPAISSRCPDYTGGSTFGNNVEIWIEVSTAFTSATAWQVQVTYTNSAGTAGRTSIISTALAAANLTQGRMFKLALQAGDAGVQKIESVIVTTGGAATGAFNVLLLRKLWGNKVLAAGGGGVDDILKTGAPIVYTDSALVLVTTPDSTSTGLPDLTIEVSNV